MSWLNSVNNLLEKLDDRVETVAEDATNILVDSDGVPVNLTGRLLGNRNASMSSDDESYYEDEDYDDDDYEEVGHDQVEEDPVHETTPLTDESFESRTADEATATTTAAVQTHEPQNGDEKQSTVKDSASDQEVDRSKHHETKVTMTADPEQSHSDVDVQSEVQAKKSMPAPTQAKGSAPPSASSVVSNKGLQSTTTNRSMQKIPPPPASSERRPPPAPRSSNASGKTASQYRSEIQKLQQEVQKLNKQNSSLQSQLTAAQNEVDAQHRELEQAAERLEEDRQLADEDREDLLDEHEDALSNLKESYEARLAHQKKDYETKLADVKQKLANETHMRVQEGGDMTEELEDAINRERHALEKVDQLQREKVELEQTNLKMKMQEESLQAQVANLTQSVQASSEREQQAEERLDGINAAHQRTLNHRQAREAELERTVAELGAALANNGKMEESKTNPSDSTTSEGMVHQRQHDMAIEELESTKGQLSMATQRCEALQNELKILSKERTDEAASYQQKQRDHDGRVEELTSKIARLEASVREYKAMSDEDVATSSTAPESANSNSQTSNANIRRLTHDLDKARRQIATLSDQLLRQQGLTESAKSEALALRGRLQSATSRAEAAEQASADMQSGGGSNGGILYERDGGGVAYGRGTRKRIKMGRGMQRGGRTMRSALGLNAVDIDNAFLEQVAHTVDGLDLWMMETGNIMKYEPLARLGLLLYLVVVHLWCFGLVFFHGVESEHGDLGSLTPLAHHHDHIKNTTP